MKKKWQIIAGLVLALIMSISIAVPALAQDEEEDVIAPANTIDGALAIIAPWTVTAGEDFTVRAFFREDQEPFPGAGVWLIGKDSTEAAKQALRQLKESQAGAEADYESILGNHGTFLGRTGPDGRLACNIAQPGGYILVAGMNGYLPGFTCIRVKDTVNALGIKAPHRAKVDQPVTMTVFERITHNPVEEAAVFAITRDNIETLKEAVQALREDTSIAPEDKDYEALCNTYGFFLGMTNGDGKLEYAFVETGVYLLVAVKMGYFPGFSRIAIVDVPKALKVKATPPRTHVGEEVTLSVTDRQTGDPVQGASMYALSHENAATLKEEIKNLRKDITDDTEKDYGAIVAAVGTYLGETDENGELVVSFDTAGMYLLVAVEPGYIPGFTLLPVKEMPEPNVTSNASAINGVRNLKSIQPRLTNFW